MLAVDTKNRAINFLDSKCGAVPRAFETGPPSSSARFNVVATDDCVGKVDLGRIVHRRRTCGPFWFESDGNQYFSTHPPPWCCNTFSNNPYLHTASVSVPACGTRRLARDSVVSLESCAFPGVAQGIRNVKSSTQHQRQTEMEEELGRVIPRSPLALGNKSLRCSQCRRTR